MRFAIYARINQPEIVCFDRDLPKDKSEFEKVAVFEDECNCAAFLNVSPSMLMYAEYGDKRGTNLSAEDVMKKGCAPRLTCHWKSEKWTKSTGIK